MAILRLVVCLVVIQAAASAVAKPILSFDVQLTPEQVVPIPGEPHPSGISTASGVVHFTLNDTPSGPTLDYEFVFSGLNANVPSGIVPIPDEDIVGIHIHTGDAGELGPISYGVLNPDHDDDRYIIDTLDNSADVLGGTWDRDDEGPGLAQPLASLIDDLYAGNLYIAVHTGQFMSPNQELRGQILPPVTPEPASLLLWTLLAAGAALVWYRRREAAA